MKYDYLFKNILDKCLVFDIETHAEDESRREIDIFSQFDAYVEYAKVKWFGAYSYKHDEVYLLNANDNTDREIIMELLNEHDTLIGFNSEEFDYPILKNNNLVDLKKKYLHVDCMQILGTSNFKNKAGYAYKNRGGLMKYKFKKNSLKVMAEAMKLDTQKGDIDYKIFQKNEWNEIETGMIKTYLQSDVVATSEMFDKLWEFWVPFTDLLSPKFVNDLSWIRSSIASLTYKAACTLMNVEPTYSENVSQKEEMGGRVIMPKYEESKGVWYIDYASLYPHVMCMFNLFAENKTSAEHYGWHGNDVFKVRGYYYETEPHILNQQVQDKLKERIALKKSDPKNPMIEAIKIFLNGLYGVIRSALFEKVHTPNAGWDTCWLGQQIQKLTEDMMDEFGFETIYGDTDSLMLLAKEEQFNNREYVQKCLKKIVKKINDNCLFPVETFNIDIEHHLDYIMFPFVYQEIVDEKTRKILNDLTKIDDEDFHPDAEAMKKLYKFEEIDGKKCIIDISTKEVVKKGRSWTKKRMGLKKNYVIIYKENDVQKVKLMGLPIKKVGATSLGLKVFEEVLKPLMIKNTSAKFTREFVENTVEEYLKKPEIMQLLAREFRIKPANTYKKASQIQAQISVGYLNGGDGVVSLIKNKKFGKAGKGEKYCTVEEAINGKLTVDDIDLKKLWNELGSFIIYEPNLIPEKKVRKKKTKKEE